MINVRYNKVDNAGLKCPGERPAASERASEGCQVRMRRSVYMKIDVRSLAESRAPALHGTLLNLTITRSKSLPGHLFSPLSVLHGFIALSDVSPSLRCRRP